MHLNQIFTLTPKIHSLLNTIEQQKTALSLLQVKPELTLNLRRHSLLSSALYSARIEGITDNTDLEKLAVQNLEQTYTWLYTQPLDLYINPDFIKSLHAKSLHNLRTDAGQWRSEQSAIFNSSGVAIYLTPPAQEIKLLLSEWQTQIATSPHHSSVQASISHYQFEKIHPFIDGNGRVGRLLFTQQLRSRNYDFGGLLVLEAAINNTRDEYYYHLQNEKKDLTGFIEYFLTLISDSANSVLNKIPTPHSQNILTGLLPRRQEILNIIHDHKIVSFDFLHRRFASVPASTLRFDLLYLQKGHYIQKLGRTRGALYSVPPTE